METINPSTIGSFESHFNLRHPYQHQGTYSGPVSATTIQSPDDMIDNGEFLSRRDSGCSPPDPADGSKEQAWQHKRKEQNRTAQRLYRERKLQRITDLQDEIRRLQSRVSALEEEHRDLHLEVCRMETENDLLRSSVATSRTCGLAPRATVCVAESGPPRKGILLKDALTIYGGVYQQNPR